MPDDRAGVIAEGCIFEFFDLILVILNMASTEKGERGDFSPYSIDDQHTIYAGDTNFKIPCLKASQVC